MPQAIAIPIATFIGGVIGTGAVATIAGTVIAGAIVGAAVGGLTAAVMGGDIGKGLLYGAVGGAVTGGISGYMGLSSGASTAATASTNLARGTATPAILNAATVSTKAAGGMSGLFNTAAGLSQGGGLLQGAGSSLIDTGGQMLKGSAEEDMMREKNAADTAMADKKLAAEIEVAKMNDATNRLGQTNQLNVAREQLAENKAQFDTGSQLAAERLARQQSAVTEARAARQGMLQGGPSIDEQVYLNEKRMVA